MITFTEAQLEGITALANAEKRWTRTIAAKLGKDAPQHLKRTIDELQEIEDYCLLMLLSK